MIILIHTIVLQVTITIVNKKLVYKALKSFVDIPAISVQVSDQETCWQIPTTASVTAPRTRTASSSAVMPWGGRAVTVASTPHVDLVTRNTYHPTNENVKTHKRNATLKQLFQHKGNTDP